MGYVRRVHLSLGQQRLSRTAHMRGDPGLFGSIAKLAGKFAKPLLRAVPGVGIAMTAADIGGAALGAGKALIKAPGRALALTRGAGAVGPGLTTITKSTMGRKLALGAGLAAGGIGAAAVGRSLMSGGARRRYRRMNPLNPKAANRAVRRIKAVRKLCRSIESSLPKQHTRTCATRGKR